MKGLEVRLYRKVNPDGTAKDWAVPVVVDPAGLDVYYGRTGETLRRAVTPAGKCRGNSSAAERDARAREKLAKGYRALGEHRLADDRRTLAPVVRNAAPPPDVRDAPERPALYWRLRAGAQTEEGFLAAVEAAAAALAPVGWLLPDVEPGTCALALWRGFGAGLDTGVVPLEEARKPAVAFLLLLARRNVGLSLADDAGQQVDRWPPELTVGDEILGTLGLKPIDTKRLLEGLTGKPWFC